MVLSKIIRIRSSCQRYTSTLIKKIISHPQLLTAEDIKSFLWTAMDYRQKTLAQKDKISLNDIKNSRIILLLTKPSIYHQISATQAAELLNVKLNILIDPKWDTTGYITDTMRFMQTHADLILAQCRLQCILEEIKQLDVPLFVYKSHRFRTMDTLADFLTIQLNFGYLKGLNITFLGLPDRLLNTYLIMGAKLGVNITYCCCQHGMQSPAALKIASQFCKKTNSILKECDNAEKAVENAKVVVISKDGHRTVTFDMMRAAAPDVKTIFHLPRNVQQIDEAVVNSRQCLTWESADNIKWMFAAVIIRLLSHYKHTMPMPNF